MLLLLQALQFTNTNNTYSAIYSGWVPCLLLLVKTAAACVCKTCRSCIPYHSLQNKKKALFGSFDYDHSLLSHIGLWNPAHRSELRTAAQLQCTNRVAGAHIDKRGYRRKSILITSSTRRYSGTWCTTSRFRIKLRYGDKRFGTTNSALFRTLHKDRGSSVNLSLAVRLSQSLGQTPLPTCAFVTVLLEVRRFPSIQSTKHRYIYADLTLLARRSM